MMREQVIENDNNGIIDKAIWFVTFIQFSFLYIVTNEYNRGPVFLLFTVIIIVLYLAKNNMKISFNFGLFHLFGLIMSFYCFVSAIWAINPTDSITKGITILEIIICLSFIYAYYSKYNNLDKLIKAIAISGFSVAIYTVGYFGVDALVQTAEAGDRLSDSFANVNTIGMVCAQSIVISLFYFLNTKKIWYLLGMVFCVVICALSGSRKALIMMTLGCFLVLYYTNSSRNLIKKIARLLFISIVSLIVLYFLLKTPLFSGVMLRMEGMINTFLGSGATESSAVVRQMMIQRAMEVFSQNPIVGVGIGNSHLVNIRDTYFHNNYVELLASGGLIGVVVYYLPYAYILFNLFKYRYKNNAQSHLIIVLVILTLLMDYGLVSYYSKSSYYLLMVYFLHVRNLRKESDN